MVMGVGASMLLERKTIDDEGSIEAQLEDPKKIPRVKWKTLYSYDYKTGETPDELKKLDGKLVRMPGFVVPLVDEFTKLEEFLLVPDAQSCVHVPPPPPNLIVYVTLRETIPVEETFNPAWITGILTIEESKSQFGSASFKMDGIKLEEFRRKSAY